MRVQVAATVATCAALLVASPAVAQTTTTYTNGAVHVDNNNGQITLNNGTVENYFVQSGLSADALRAVVVDAQRTAGADWRAEFRRRLDALNRQSTAVLERLSAQIEASSAKEEELRKLMTDLAASKDSADASRSEGLSRQLYLIQQQLQQMYDGLSADRTQRAEEAADRAHRLAFDYDDRWDISGRIYGTTILPFADQPAFSHVAYTAGITVGYDFHYFDSVHTRSLGFRGGFLGGEGSAGGGFQDPGHHYLARLTIPESHFLPQVSLAYKQRLALRLALDVALSVRGGYVWYQPPPGVNMQGAFFGSLQTPVDVTLSYKPLRVLSFGASIGAGAEYFASQPVQVYTGVGADSNSTGTSVKPLLEVGANASICW